MSTKSSKKSQGTASSAAGHGIHWYAGGDGIPGVDELRFWENAYLQAQSSYGVIHGTTMADRGIPTADQLVTYAATVANNAVIHRRNVSWLTQTAVSGL